MILVGVFLLLLVGVLCAADGIVAWLEERPEERFQRVLAALERITSTDR